MKFFDALGASVDARWKRHHYDEDVFPAIATEALEELRPSDHVAMMDIVTAIHAENHFLAGERFDAPFGQPPVLVFRTPHLWIQVLFWLESTTAVHQHGFSGAFHVLEGSSIHAQFSFERTKRYSDRLFLGTLARTSVEHLRKGAVRPILKGSGTIHSLFHLDHPSISVVVRTPGSAVDEPQYNYLFPGIAYDPFFRTETLYLRQKTLRVLAKLKHPQLEEVAVRAIRDADGFDAFQLMLELMLSIDAPDDYERLLDAVLPAQADLVAAARAAADARYRERNITIRRASIQRTEHRFLLGVLLNTRSRADALALVEQAYPGLSPVERITGWVAELGQATIPDPTTEEVTSPIGVVVAGTELTIFRHLLSGAPDEQVLARLREEFGDAVDEQREDLLAVCTAFRTSWLFRLLLS